ncbi:MAG: PspC domain-containing protein [Actinomycetota bacterium]|nr:PspC domain-containing protein [Actinomycetota bacterium]
MRDSGATVELPRLTRAAHGRLVSGVAAGLAEHLGLRPVVIRAAFVALTFAGGAGLAMYAAFWMVVPQSGGALEPQRREEWVRSVALLALGLGVFLLFQANGWGTGGGTLLPLAAVVVGLSLVWRQADDAQRQRWRTGAASGRGGLVRLAAGAILLATGLTGFLAFRGQLGAAQRGLESTLVVVLGLALLSGPWWFRMTADLRAERRERIRSQERAEVAAHVHDSVLQTLALIQKAAEDPREVTRLARSQERELRGWLYRATSPTAEHLAGALERAAADVELAHGVAVEVVVVGDGPLDPRLEALVAATREALVNAARHSGAPTVSLYAEIDPERATVFVRDRGRGFDPESVPEDRMGLAGSVTGRMARHGGTAEVRSAPGEGTEIRMEVPRG